VASLKVADDADHLLLDRLLPDDEFHEVHAVVASAKGTQVFATVTTSESPPLPAADYLPLVASRSRWAARLWQGQ
jgi:hypothetical protein